MDKETASVVGTIIGSAVFSFAAQVWGNFVTRRARDKILRGSAAQTTVDEIRQTVQKVDSKTDVLVKQPGIVTADDRSPKGDGNGK